MGKFDGKIALITVELFVDGGLAQASSAPGPSRRGTQRASVRTPI
jgi:hypothetical protein